MFTCQWNLNCILSLKILLSYCVENLKIPSIHSRYNTLKILLSFVLVWYYGVASKKRKSTSECKNLSTLRIFNLPVACFQYLKCFAEPILFINLTYDRLKANWVINDIITSDGSYLILTNYSAWALFKTFMGKNLRHNLYL